MIGGKFYDIEYNFLVEFKYCVLKESDVLKKKIV